MEQHFTELGREYHNELAQNFIISDGESSSSRHSVNFRNSVLLLDEGSTDDINGSVGEQEKKCI